MKTMWLDRQPGEGVPAARRLLSERGQTLVVVAAIIVGLVAFLGLVIDGGNVYAQRRQMQNAADAAALAGARKLAQTKGNDPDAVRAAAAEYAIKGNGATTCTTTIDGTHVTVTVDKDVSTYFIPVIGISSISVGAVARAGVYEVTETGCMLIPLAVQERAPGGWPAADVDFRIWDSDPGTPISGKDDVLPEFYGWLNPNGGGPNANELNCWLGCPQPCPKPMPPLKEGMWVNGDPGGKNSALKTMGACWTNQIVLIPVYDIRCDKKDAKDGAGEGASMATVNDKKQTPTPALTPTPTPTSCWVDGLGNGHANYHIVRFMPFLITKVEAGGNPKYIEGHIVDGYVAGTDCVKGYKADFGDVSTVRLEPVAP